MRNGERIVVALIASLAIGVIAAFGQDWTPIAAKTKDSVFRLRAVLVSGGGETVRLCSATVINGTKQEIQKQRGPFLLTAAHCIPEEPKGRSLEVQNKHAEIAKVNYALDLAIVSVPRLEGTPLARRRDEAPIGLPVAVVGAAFGTLANKYTFGWVSQVDDRQLTLGVLVSATFIPGQSGGAVVDASGHLVSLVQAFVTARGQGVGIGAQPKAIADFAQDYWPAPTHP